MSSPRGRVQSGNVGMGCLRMLFGENLTVDCWAPRAASATGHQEAPSETSQWELANANASIMPGMGTGREKTIFQHCPQCL